MDSMSLWPAADNSASCKGCQDTTSQVQGLASTGLQPAPPGSNTAFSAKGWLCVDVQWELWCNGSYFQSTTKVLHHASWQRHRSHPVQPARTGVTWSVGFWDTKFTDQVGFLQWLRRTSVTGAVGSKDSNVTNQFGGPYTASYTLNIIHKVTTTPMHTLWSTHCGLTMIEPLRIDVETALTMNPFTITYRHEASATTPSHVLYICHVGLKLYCSTKSSGVWLLLGGCPRKRYKSILCVFHA